MTSWKISGQYMESCNCDYLCPCVISNPQDPATHDNCYSMMVYHIETGHYGDTKLDGQTFGLVIRSGKVMADGNWIFAGVVDEKADPSQREALAAIVSGEAGGVPGMIRTNLVGDFRGIEYRPISHTADGLKRTASIPGVFSFAIEGVASRNKSGDAYYLDNTGHPANRRLALARTTSLHVEGFGLSLAMDGKANNGHYAPFTWSG